MSKTEGGIFRGTLWLEYGMKASFPNGLDR